LKIDLCSSLDIHALYGCLLFLGVVQGQGLDPDLDPVPSPVRKTGRLPAVLDPVPGLEVLKPDHPDSRPQDRVPDRKARKSRCFSAKSN